MSDFFNGPITAVNCHYPVGSIYMTVASSNPGTLFGGIWEEITGKMLVGCGGTSGIKNGETGGSWDNEITENNIPSHMHEISTTTDGGTGGVTTNLHLNAWKNGDTIGAAFGWAESSGNFSDSSCDNHLPADWSGSEERRFGYGGTTSLTEPQVAESTYRTTQIEIENEYHDHGIIGNTQTTGNNTPFTVAPPYLGVHMWKRIS